MARSRYCRRRQKHFKRKSRDKVGVGSTMLSKQHSSDRLKLNQEGRGLFFSLIMLYKFEPGVSHHHQHHVTMPAMPVSYFIIGHAYFTFSVFN